MMPEMGGMLRYGIPQYRLPKEVLDKELKLVEKLGIEFKNNIKYSLQGTTQGRYLTGGVPPVRFSM